MRSLKEINILIQQIHDKMHYLSPIADSERLAELRREEYTLSYEKTRVLYHLSQIYGQKYYGWAKQLQAELEEKFCGSTIDTMTENAISNYIQNYVFGIASQGEIHNTEDAESLVVVFNESLTLNSGREV